MEWRRSRILSVRRDHHPHRERFEQLKVDRGSPQQRGLQFERLIQDLFRQAHYRVERGAGAARPRQTDVLATSPGHDTLLIECKWRKQLAGSDDVDSLRSRLNRIPGAVTGVLISVSGFTAAAIKEVEGRREQPILLVGAEELDEVTDTWGDLRQMLSIKAEMLLIQGRVHLLANASTPPPAPRHPVGPPTLGDEVFVDNTGRVPWIAAPGGFGQFTFTREIHSEWFASDPGVVLDIPLASLRHQDDLVWALCEFASLGWTTGGGHWSLHQQETNWHGIGAASLSVALEQRMDRYEGAGRIHRTEELTYYDRCDGGFYTLTAELDSRAGEVSYAALSMQMAGVPFDQHPLEELCRTFGVFAPLFYRPRVNETSQDGASMLRDGSPLTPVALILHEDPDDSHDPHWVCGIVAVNPLFRAGIESDDAGQLPWALRESQLIVCDVPDWHPVGERHTYRLQRCRWTETSDALIVRAVANWPSSEISGLRDGATD